MKKILGIEVPDDLSSLDNAALTKLAADLRAAAVTALKGDVTPDVLAECREAKTFAASAVTETATRVQADADLAAERDALLAEVEDTEGDDEDAAGDESESEGGDEATDAGEDAAEGEAESTEEAAESVTAAYRPTAAAVAAVSPKVEQAGQVQIAHKKVPVLAAGGLDGIGAGEEFSDLVQLGEALGRKWQSIAGGSGEKITVGKINGQFDQAQKLTKNIAKNLEMFGGTDLQSPESQAIVAAMCAPREPYYGMAWTSSTQRPVQNSLVRYVPERGGVSIYPTPKLTDVTDGKGVWTRANDADDEATKAACATIPCADVVNYDIYGVYRCLTVKNLLQLTFPELMEAYINRLQALWARLAEITMLNGMMGSVNVKDITYDGGTNDLGAGINLFSALTTARTLYCEEERWDDNMMFQAWAPRWIKGQLKRDYINQRRTSGKLSDRFISDADLNAALLDVGLDVTWTMDIASSWSSLTLPTDGDPLPDLPADMDILLSPRGNFRALDRGDLSIGVTNNNIFRDNASNSKNEFTMFWESFEGIIDFGAPSYHLQLTTMCPNGAQAADVDAMVCSGS